MVSSLSAGEGIENPDSVKCRGPGEILDPTLPHPPKGGFLLETSGRRSWMTFRGRSGMSLLDTINVSLTRDPFRLMGPEDSTDFVTET